MYRLLQPGRIIFGIGIAALGVFQFFVKDFIVARPPSPAWAADIPGKLAWAYVSGTLLILSGLAIVFNKKVYTAAIFIALLTFIGSFLSRNIPEMFTVKTAEAILWKVNAYKALAICGGALIVAASAIENDRRTLPTKNVLITTGCILFSLFLIIACLAHFKFADFVQTLVPEYIGNQYFWTYFAAIALFLGGIGILFRPTRKWAAVLTGVMIFLWFILLHIPRAINIPPHTSVPIYGEWMGVFESFAFSGIFFVLAGLSSSK